jgi:Rv2632c-like
MQVAGWHVEVEFDEDESHTRAAALLRLRDGSEVRARGRAARNPSDLNQPKIGEEIAGARALSALAEQLLHKAEGDIEQITHQRAHIHT